MLKYAHVQIMTKALAPQDASARELRRFAHRHHFDYQVRPGYLYVRSRAISSRCNDNFDEFPAEELEKAYATFKGKPVFVNHHNDDHKRARGVIIDAALHKDANRDGTKDYWVEVLMEVDALRFPKLAAEIMNGNIARTSMGCDVAFSVCSACGNKATTPAEYCHHIPASKGMTLYRTTASGHKVGDIIRETCYGLKFFENSLLVEPPADPTAFFLGVDTRGMDRTAAYVNQYEHEDKTAGKDPRFAEVGLKQDDKGWYVTTHRARSNSYETPEKIPQAEVERIAATGAKTAAHAYSWDEIGQMHPHVYGEEGGDSWGIGDAASHLAHDREEDPDAEGSDVSEMKFHFKRVKPSQIDHQRHESYDDRVQHAAQGYRNSPEDVPPLVLVHRHGVYQVADGHHRAAGAKAAGVSSVPAYVAYSPHEDEPFSDGSRAPFHGAAKSPATPPGRKPVDYSGPGHEQGTLFEAMRKGAPFAGYDDFEDCTSQNSDKDDPDAYCGEIKHKTEDGKKTSRLTLAELMAEGINQEGGELPAFPWDRAPKINLPMTQKGWDDPRRKTMYDAKGERDMKGPQPAGPYQHLIDKLPDYATQELTNPHGMGAADVGRTSVPPDTYPGDKKEQWARHRWDNVKWPSWTDHSDRPSTPTEIAASKRNIRNRWSKTWKRPLACDHPGCPPWEHEGDPRRPTAPTSASDITMPNGHPLDPFQQFLDGDGGGTSKEAAQQYPNPADHPWFKETGLSHEHILHHWDQATPEEKAQGARWYPDAHLVAKSIAKLDPRIKSDKEAAHKGGGVLSAYSPQQGWWANQHNAARSFQEQRAIGKGEGIMVMASHANAAQKIMDGMPHQEALKGPKTQDFAHLIEHGGNDEHGNPSQRVVVDRHALSVAAGRRLNADDVKGFPSQNRHYYEHAAEHYRRAAAVASDREGRTVPPHEMQATTWLVRQRLNATEDTSPGQKGRNTVQQNQRKVWQDTSREHSPELHEPPTNSHVARADVGGYRIQHASPGPETGFPYHQVSSQHGPEDLVDVFRAVPKHADRINQGDWVTLRGDWAQDRADSAPGMHVIQARVPARHVYVDRNSKDIDEAGYHGPHMTGPSVRPRDGATPDQPRLFEGRKVAFGEQKAPADVDTLREDACPVCGDRDTFDGATCQVCGYVAPPKMFQDPDLEKARQMDLRKDIADFQDPANPMAQGQVGPDGQPIGGGPMDPGALDANGNPINPDAADPNAQPGSLPGEVQAEVQPGGDPMDPAALGPDGMPIDPQGDPNELGAPVDPAMLGPDGQPLQQPGQQMMVGPNGEPIGPQALPADAMTDDGKPFTPGPNMPMGPGEPESPQGPEAPLSPDEVGSEGQIPTDAPGDGQIPNPDAGQGVPGTPGDGVPDLQCPACGFTADATNPVSVDMDTSIMPPTGEATPDGVQAGDICPNCGAGQLISPAEATGQVPVPMPV